MRTLIALLLVSGCADAQWRVMPMPASIRAGEGRMAIGQGFSIQPGNRSYSRASKAIGRMQGRIERLTGMKMQGGGPGLSLQVSQADTPVQSLEADESYRLEITSTQALLAAPNVLGAMHGLET